MSATTGAALPGVEPGSLEDRYRLLIPMTMACVALGVWLFTPDHAGRDLDQTAT